MFFRCCKRAKGYCEKKILSEAVIRSLLLGAVEQRENLFQMLEDNKNVKMLEENKNVQVLEKENKVQMLEDNKNKLGFATDVILM